MDLRETLSAQLPPTRPDEPARLRQDILDELNDHLVCAFNRELLRGVDRAVAERRVLEQFGDPAALARRLWLDEMKGKIMAQRLVVVTCLVVTAASLALVGLFWQQSVRAQQMAARQAEVAHAREQEVLHQLRAMSEAIQHPRSMDWNPVRMKLTEEATDGPPVASATIMLTRLFENPPKTIQKVSDASGLVDFGSVQPGDYSFQVFRNSKAWTLQSSGELNVQPGSDVTKSIICPKAPPQRVGVTLRWQWPADLENEPLLIYAPFAFRDREVEPGVHWSMSYSFTRKARPGTLSQFGGPEMFEAYPPVRSVLCGPSNTITEFLDSRTLFLWTIMTGNLGAKFNEAAKLGPGDWADVLAEYLESKPTAATIELELGRYTLSELIVLRPSQSRDVEPGRTRFDVLAAACDPSFTRHIDVAPAPPSRGDLEWIRYHDLTGILRQNGGGWGPGMTASRPTLVLPREYWRERNKGLEARIGQPNEWTIPIPAELAQAVREALKADKAPKAKPAEKSAAVKGNG